MFVPLKPYERKVYYYETDKMGIMHHSNYIKLFEEARIDFLEQVSFSLETIESMGIMCPVISVESHYKAPLKFNDTFVVHYKFSKFNGVFVEIQYKVVNKTTGEICNTGNSVQCYTDENMKPIRLKHKFPEVYELFEHYKNYDTSEVSAEFSA